MLAFVVVGPGIANAQSTAPAPHFAFTGDAFGTEATVLGGVVGSGPTAPVGLGCNTAAGVHLTNTVVSTSLPPLLSTGTVHTTADTSQTGILATSSTTATTQSVNLLLGVVSADAIEAASATSHDSGGFHTSAAGSSLVNLVVAGQAITAVPPPNTKVNLLGLGYVILNEQKVGSANRSLTVNMVHVVITITTPLAQAGTQIIISHAASDLEGPVTGTLDGHAYGTRANAANIVNSGPTAPVGVGCIGTGGHIRSNTVVGVNVPGIINTATVTDTAQGSASPTALNSETTSTVQSANLLSGTVTVDAVHADAHASWDGTTSTFSDSGSTFVNLTVGGQVINVNVPPNTQINVAGLGVVWLHRVIRHPSSIEVRMIEVIVTTGNSFGLPIGLDVRIAVAEASVHPS